MTRETLSRIIRQAAGVEVKGKAMHVAADQDWTLYVGQPGQAMLVRHVRSLDLQDDVLVASCDDDVQWFVTYDSVHAVSQRSGHVREPRRPGF